MEIDPEKVEEITNLVGDLNEFLRDLEYDRQNTDIKKGDLIQGVVESTTFEELTSYLERAKEFIGQQPKIEKTPKQNPGWGAV